MKTVRYRTVEGSSSAYRGLLVGLGLLLLLGLWAAHAMETQGHFISGMNNRVVWGTPHVFAIFLIVAASGALNVASISSVFSLYGSNPAYKPLSRLSGLLSIALLAGGLAVLVLDLGRPDRLIVAMTYYNFKSIFAWNIFLYTGFFAVVALYLWMMFDRRMQKFSKPAGYAAFLWRLTLTTGTGSIFGFLVARDAYDAAIMAPMFIIMSFSFGLAVFILVVQAASHYGHLELGHYVLRRLKNLLGIFVGAVLYFLAVYHVTNLYATQHQGVETFMLLDGGIYTTLFWIGHVLLGAILPLYLLYSPGAQLSCSRIAIAASLVIVGGLALIYVLLIGGQAYPMPIYPGYEASGGFLDTGIAPYTPSLYELLLGLGGVAIALLIVALGVKVLPFLPESMADDKIDPHHDETAPGDAAPSNG